jgi:hypothetical protein
VQEHRRQDDGDADRARDQGDGQDGEDAGPQQVDGHDEQPAVHPVGHRARHQAEEQPGQRLQQRGEGDEDGIPRLRRDQQRPRREADPVPEAAHPRGAGQPPERRAHPRRQHGVEQSTHEAETLGRRSRPGRPGFADDHPSWPHHGE